MIVARSAKPACRRAHARQSQWTRPLEVKHPVDARLGTLSPEHLDRKLFRVLVSDCLHLTHDHFGLLVPVLPLPTCRVKGWLRNICLPEPFPSYFVLPTKLAPLKSFFFCYTGDPNKTPFPYLYHRKSINGSSLLESALLIFFFSPTLIITDHGLNWIWTRLNF